MKKQIHTLKSSTIPSINKPVSWNSVIPSSNQTSASEMKYDKECPLQINYIPYTNIQMLEIYKELKFDDPDGGVWKQGFEINYDVRQWNKHHKLKVNNRFAV